MFLIGKALASTIGEKIRKPKVVGTFIYWKKGCSDRSTNVDLNAINKIEISVGRNTACDISIDDPSIATTQFKLVASKVDGEMIITLHPVGEVNKGYRRLSDQTELEETITYSFGEYEFRFYQDPNII